MVTKIQLEEIDIRDTQASSSSSSTQSAVPFYDKLVHVIGTTKSGTTEMIGILTGITYTEQVIVVYMEGQQNTAFDPSKTGIWLSLAV